MSGPDEDKGFLSRWSQRKREAAVPKDESREETIEGVEASPATPHDIEEPFDLSSLPGLEEITERTDIVGFLRKGVPESLRNAALRKVWALDPVIRNYVNPALDYAYDWNTPGGVPGSGEIAAGTDIPEMVRQIMGSDSTPADFQSEGAAGRDTDVTSANEPQIAAPQDSGASLPFASTRLSGDVTQAKPEIAESEASDGTAALRDADAKDLSASQQKVRRHGAAKPRV